ncbi:GntR family transcriptional regulator [Leeia sp.]|uniref:GntR family transcriptional regulator n=1 Tax=Leeia sp. TaxID=2884678 RepID=UPI0035B10206
MSEEELYQEIFDAIMSRQLPPGTKLTEVTLCEIFGVKRNALRKVLSQLASKKMVELHFNRGAFVATPTVDEARDTFEVRRVLETAVVAKMAGQSPKPQLGTLRNLVKEERQCFHDKDYPGWVRRSLDFHNRLVELSGNQVMVEYVQNLVLRYPLISALYDPRSSNCCSFDEHDAILDAIESGNATLAVQCMTSHLGMVEHKLNLMGAEPAVSLEHVFRSRTVQTQPD